MFLYNVVGLLDQRVIGHSICVFEWPLLLLCVLQCVLDISVYQPTQWIVANVADQTAPTCDVFQTQEKEDIQTAFNG